MHVSHICFRSLGANLLILVAACILILAMGCLTTSSVNNTVKGTITPSSALTPLMMTVSTTPTTLGVNPSENSFIAQAEETIRRFTNNSHQNLTFEGTVNESYACFYKFKSENSSFWVNNRTNRVQSASWYEEGTKNQNEILNLDQGSIIAESYAKERYPELWNINITKGIRQTVKRVNDRGLDRIFEYYWQEILYNPDNNTKSPSEILGVNSVSIDVSPYTGHVTQYHEQFELSKTLPNLTATLTEDQAKLFAVLYFESTGIADVREYELESGGLHITRDIDNNQRLAWSFSLTHTDKYGFDNGGIVSIDAHNGNVVWHVSFF